MVARRLWITLQQVIRSILIILFPLAFIALFAWATAGSTYGTTSDPMRAAVWLWLGAHLTPFYITSNEITGYLSYLPIGAVILPWLTMRNGYRRSLQVIQNKKISRAYFILSYTLVYLLLAAVTVNSQISIDWLRGVITLFILLLTATSSFKLDSFVKLPWQIFLFILGIGGLVFSTSLLLNFSTAKNLAVVIQPGIFGGVLLLLLQLLYLPNIAFASLSYILGSGFSLGAATTISPFVFDLREIPAIPVLAALPTGKHMWLAILSLLVAVYGWINLDLISKLDINKKSKLQLKIRFVAISIAGAAILAFITSGSLISANMSPVGVNSLRICVVIAAQLLLVILVMYLKSIILEKKQVKGRLAR